MGQAHIRYGLVTRLFELSRDYAMVEAWWNAHGSFPPRPEHLSATGIIVEADKPICAGWFYHTDSKICIFEFVVSDPSIAKELRDAALDFLIETIKKLAARSEYKLIYTSTSIPRYVKRLIGSGFIEADKGQTHCFYEVGNVQNVQ